MSRYQSEMRKSQEQVKTRRGKREVEKNAGLSHGNSNEAQLKKPRQWPELLYYKLLPASGLHKVTSRS